MSNDVKNSVIDKAFDAKERLVLMRNQSARPDHDREVIGLFPAGGQAKRIAPLPCSKELYPVGFRAIDGGQSVRPKAVCHYLLERMQLAGINKVYIILRPGKWDIPAYLGDGSMVQMHLAYLMMNLPFGAPYTLDQAYPFVQNALVALGFPDIIFQPEDAFMQLLARQKATMADVVLGLFPASHPQKMDMVELHGNGQVQRIIIKPYQTKLRYTWIIAVWTPAFTRFMHQFLAATLEANEAAKIEKPNIESRELYVGDVIQAAIDDGMRVDSVIFPEGHCLDIGTPDELVQAVHNNVQLI